MNYIKNDKWLTDYIERYYSNYIDYYYAAQNVNLCVDELEELSFYSDYRINKNLKYHPNCTINLHEAIKSVGFIIW